jgi:peptide/nickel transport system substrate-binding protein
MTLQSVPETELSRRELLQRAGAGAAALSALSAAPALAASRRREIERLTWALNAPIGALNQYRHTDGVTMAALANSLEGLLSLDDRFRIRPGLARSWGQPDATTYVYRLRGGVEFWDGTPLTVDDVVYSMRQHIDPDVGSAQASFYSTVRSIRATRRDEVTVKLKTPDAIFRYTPAIHTRYVIQRRFAERNFRELGSPDVLTMGTGPYRISAFEPDGSVTLVRNDRYWGRLPAAREVVLRIIPDPATRLLAMRSGEIDGAFDVDDIEQWQRIAKTRMLFAPALRVLMVSMNVQNPPFDDVHVRRAIAHEASSARSSTGTGARPRRFRSRRCGSTCCPTRRSGGSTRRCRSTSSASRRRRPSSRSRSTRTGSSSPRPSPASSTREC